MRCISWISIMLVLVGADLVGADEYARRTTRVASTPVRHAPKDEPPKTAPVPLPTPPPPVADSAPTRTTLLEPSYLLEGVGRGMVACFQVQADQAAIWQLVVQEIDGPVAQIFEGEGSPPSSIPWDGRLLDGGLAWSGMIYTYYVAYVDSSGEVGEAAGAPFALPAYTREERLGISFLIPGDELAPGRRSGSVTAAMAGLKSVSERLNQDGGVGAVRIEVLARDDTAALELGEAVRKALADLLDPGDRNVELYVGSAAAAPPAGTVLITTVQMATPPG